VLAVAKMLQKELGLGLDIVLEKVHNVMEDGEIGVLGPNG